MIIIKDFSKSQFVLVRADVAKFKMSLRSYYPWRVSATRPLWMTLDDSVEYFPFSSLVPRWRSEAAWDPFTEFERMQGTIAQPSEQAGETNDDNKKIGHVSDDKTFAYNFDLTGFAPKDIKVKTVGQKVVVEAEHEENEQHDGCHSFCHRHYHRSVMLPKNVKPENLKSKLSKDGVLSITAPLAIKAPETNEREIAIEQEDVPAVEETPMSES